MVVLTEAGHHRGFQSVAGGQGYTGIASDHEHHQLVKRSPFFFKMMKFLKKKLNPLPIP